MFKGQILFLGPFEVSTFVIVQYRETWSYHKALQQNVFFCFCDKIMQNMVWGKLVWHPAHTLLLQALPKGLRKDGHGFQTWRSHFWCSPWNTFWNTMFIKAWGIVYHPSHRTMAKACFWKKLYPITIEQPLVIVLFSSFSSEEKDSYIDCRNLT